jgi:alpha-1,3-mannosyltransferase
MTTERRLRVLHVVRQFEPSRGGLETYVTELATRQATKHDVTVLTLNRVFGDHKRLAEVEESDGFTVVRVPFVGFRRLFLPFVGPHKVKNYDIIHIHAADQLLDVIAAISWLWPLKFFMTTHGLFFHTETLALVKKAYLATITKWGLGRAQAVFAVSMNDASTLKRVGIDSILLRNPVVPLGDFICEGEDLLYVGRISANKRIDALIAFMAHLVRVHPSISLHIVGEDNEKLWRDLSNAVVRQNLQNNIIYHGFLDTSALTDIAKTCGFTVSASRYEGFGLSVVEGMSVGLLPCMHANAAFEETFRLSGCGLLTNFDDPSCAAQAFLEWFPQAQRTDREKAAKFAHSQSWDSAILAYEQHYLEN